MTFDFISTLSENKIFHSKKTIEKYTDNELAEIALLLLFGIRILILDKSKWVYSYCDKTAIQGGFDKWRTDATELYSALYGLSENTKKNYGLNEIWHFTRKCGNGVVKESDVEKFFTKIDTYLHIKNDHLSSLRRSILDFPKLSKKDKKIAMTRLLKMMKDIAAKTDMYKHLQKYAYDKFKIDESVMENASAGATSSASVAGVVRGLGAGFSNDYSKSIYGKQKPQKIIKR